MKRTLCLLLCFAVVLTGCGREKHVDPVVPASVTEPEPETSAHPIAEREAELQTEGEGYLFDEQGVLTEEERAQYDAYLTNLSHSRQIHAAAVITDSLNGASPAEFAENYYQELFGESAGSGFLMLINNDTGEDFIYTAGACTRYLADTALPIAKATPLLVEGKYADALEILLAMGEWIPDRVLDRADALDDAETQTLLQQANALELQYTVLLTKDAPGEDVTAFTEPTAPTLPPEALEEGAESDAENPDAENPDAENPDAENPDAENPDAENPDAENPDEENPDEENPDEENPDAENPDAENPDAEDSGEAETKELPPVSDELKAYAEEIRTANGAQQLLVLDVLRGYAWIAGGSESFSEEVQQVLREQGAFAAAQRYFAVMQN